jgi:hypothetical protein
LADCNQGARGQRPEPAAYLHNFVLIQITSTLANQYSVLIIHVFSPFVIAPVQRAQSRQKKSLRRECLYVAAALAVGISVGGAGESQGAFGRSPEAAGYLHYFVFVQVTSALASQHSVLIIHTFLLSSFGSVNGP